MSLIYRDDNARPFGAAVLRQKFRGPQVAIFALLANNSAKPSAHNLFWGVCVCVCVWMGWRGRGCLHTIAMVQVRAYK